MSLVATTATGIERLPRTLRQVTDEYRRKLYLLVEEPFSAYSMGRIRDTVMQFDLEVRTLPEDRVDNHAYGVLRQSLRESQRRHELLQQDMNRHQDANEELVNTLAALKDSNKRLMEQVRKETEEIGVLTQMRVEDERRIEHIQHIHLDREEHAAKESQRRLSALQNAADDRYQQLQAQHKDKSRIYLMRLEMLKQELITLRTSTQSQKHDIFSFSEHIGLGLQRFHSDAQQRIQTLVDHFKESLVRVQAQADANDRRYQQEKEMRQREVLSWSHRHSALQAEKDTLESTSHRELALYSDKIQKLDGQITTERDNSAAAQRKSIEDERDLERIQQEFEMDRRLREQQSQEHMHTVLKLEEKIRETDGSEAELKARLLDAQEQHTHARAEVEVQARRSQLDADEVQAAHDRQLSAKEDDLRALGSALQQMRESLAETQEHHALVMQKVQSDHENMMRRTLDDARRKEETLMSDVIQTQSRIEDSQRAADELKTECYRARTSIIDTTAHLNQMKAENERLERERESISRELDDARRLSVSRESELLTRQKLLEERTFKEEEKSESVHFQLSNAQENLLRAKDDFARIQQQSQEVHNVAIATYEAKFRDAKEEVAQLEHAVKLERQEAHTNKEQFTLWSEKQDRQAKAHQEDFHRKMLSKDAEKIQFEEQVKADMSLMRAELIDAKQKAESQSAELLRSRALLSELQANLSWAKTEKERDEREIDRLRKRHDDECRLLSESLDSVRQEQLNERRKVEVLKREGEVEKMRFREEFDAARTDMQMEASRQVESTKQECKSKLKETESRFFDELNTEKSKIDTVTHENGRLKQYIGEHRSASRGLTKLHTDLEAHLHRLERHAEDLRGDLHQKVDKRNDASRFKQTSYAPNPRK